jgi:hypothetical protein
MDLEKPPNNFYINDKVFEGQLLPGILKLGIHQDECGLLRTELITILKNDMSEENWEFISAIYRVNKNKEWPPNKIQKELEYIVKEYIGEAAVQQININGEDVNKLLGKKVYSVKDFESILIDVFNQGIIYSLNAKEEHVINFAKCESLILNALETANLLNNIIKPQVPFFDKKKEEKWLTSSRNIALQAQKDIYELVNTKNILRKDFHSKFHNILVTTQQKLTAILPKNIKNTGVDNEINNVINSLQDRVKTLNADQPSPYHHPRV